MVLFSNGPKELLLGVLELFSCVIGIGFCHREAAGPMVIDGFFAGLVSEY